jgi:hypothetical protein
LLFQKPSSTVSTLSSQSSPKQPSSLPNNINNNDNVNFNTDSIKTQYKYQPNTQSSVPYTTFAPDTTYLFEKFPFLLTRNQNPLFVQSLHDLYTDHLSDMTDNYRIRNSIPHFDTPSNSNSNFNIPIRKQHILPINSNGNASQRQPFPIYKESPPRQPMSSQKLNYFIEATKFYHNFNRKNLMHSNRDVIYNHTQTNRNLPTNHPSQPPLYQSESKEIKPDIYYSLKRTSKIPFPHMFTTSSNKTTNQPLTNTVSLTNPSSISNTSSLCIPSYLSSLSSLSNPSTLPSNSKSAKDVYIREHRFRMTANKLLELQK